MPELAALVFFLVVSAWRHRRDLAPLPAAERRQYGRISPP
jgi:hypothetical protein